MMELKDMIFRRRSVRRFTGVPVEDKTVSEILDFCGRATPLYLEISVKARVVTKEQVRFYLPWKTPQLLAIFTEKKPGYAQNAGFLFQQVDLYLQSRGLGSCWLGLGKLREAEGVGVTEEGMEFLILIAFGYPEEKTAFATREFHRKPLGEIADLADPRLECARVAPSATNSQPWYFTHEGDTIHAWQNEAGFLRHKMLGTMNEIDMGIALAHVYVSNPKTFRFFHTSPAQPPKGYRYTGSFTV